MDFAVICWVYLYNMVNFAYELAIFNDMTHCDTLNDYISSSIRNNWNLPALTDFHGNSYFYKDVARKAVKLHILYEHCGIKKGDKIAICGRNSSQWAIAFLATVTYGAVIVPILSDFKPDNIHHLVNHSESKLLFVDSAIWENLDYEVMEDLDGVISIQDYSLFESRSKKLSEAREHLNELFGKRFPERFNPENFVANKVAHDDMIMINYTSGSTGFSKGVMLSERSILSNVQFCIDNIPWLNAGDATVSMLPLAHMYGLTIDLIHEFVKGCHINFLTRTPSPKIIMEAFAEVKPKIIISVPLIIEKIIKTRVFPLLDKPMMKILMHVPFVDDHLLGKIKSKLEVTFGGNLCEMIIGGAGLNKDVETFLRRIDFPFTVGYGMTECGPLISYAPWNIQRPSSCGRVVDRMEARVDSEDPANVPGVIKVKGDNVMLGYFKNQKATDDVLDKDGWLNTGDIGCIDNDNFIYLRGRDKNMILGPSGQNIYPEEIEQALNNMPYVGESVVIDEGGKLVALVYPDIENSAKEGIAEADIPKVMEENRVQLNKELPSYSQIAKIRIMNEEFEKTPKRSIKRYLYQHS